jgi:hypothetical protein
MALQRAPLKQGIVKLMQDMATRENPSHEEFAERLSSLIETFVKSGAVTGTTASACTAGGNAGTCTATIS